MKNNITITIEGRTKSGKSRVAYIVKELLKVHGFEVEFNPLPDFNNETEFNRAMRTDLDEACEAISKQTKIVVLEKQKKNILGDD